MTKDEAVEILSRIWSANPQHVLASKYVDAFVALGMLKLDEPKNAEQEFSTMLYGYINGPDADAILGGMSQRGLKIIKA